MTWVAVVVAVVGAGAAVYQGEESAKAGRKASRDQDKAQKSAVNRTVTQERLAAQAEAAANRKKPNIDSLLFDERTRADMGPGSTILAGRGGGKPLLGRKSTMMGGT